MPARTGQEYLAGLRQRRRDIWLNGEQVDDVVSHPAQANCARMLAHRWPGTQVPAPERIQLFRLAWDIVGSAFGSRQVLYERYFSGDPVRLTAGRYLTYAKAPLLERVCAFLQQAD